MSGEGRDLGSPEVPAQPADAGGLAGSVDRAPGASTDPAGTRVLALDFGAARCGVAVSDPTRTLATPLDPVLRPATRRGLDRLATVVRQTGAVRVVLGLPLSLSGAEGGQAAETRAFAERLRGRLGDVPVELYDERFTTRIAARTGAGSRASEDSRAAAVLLEDWLAARGSGA